jgi:hypothetical protein
LSASSDVNSTVYISGRVNGGQDGVCRLISLLEFARGFHGVDEA